ncbi:cytidine deaminase [Pelagibaculum spongiae]|uniref:Cytidine deaminase n=1 Tax=Pelagibaculum spongiae TaxID=2080658 RepID=A0A2V1GNB0_9GAMM|nr:cytidine deaminase [Pelagibaculum spongiae]PVZ63528.1 cytidine deaminase [Pelagibaculum spongiae]
MDPRFNSALESLPEMLAKALDPILDETFEGYISAGAFAQLQQQTGLEERPLLLAMLPVAACMAKPPISNFYVGAIARGSSGDLYMGANHEFTGEVLGHSIHAEQSAISHAWKAGETGLLDITVNYSPCGHCRQFMNELSTAGALTINLPGRAPGLLSSYLPYAFGPIDLDNHNPMMSEQPDWGIEVETNDPLVEKAVSAACNSYAPYSKSPAGVALILESGEIVSGRYGENAAFNPSMQPMQMAINALARRGRDISTIARAVLVEKQDAQISEQNHAAAVLATVCDVKLEVILV